MKTVEARARAAADLAAGEILASVEVAAAPERVFCALAPAEIVEWWVNPGVFDTREWEGDVRPGGRWRASGIGRGGPYAIQGEFVEVEAPRRLVHTWVGPGGAPTTVTYTVEAIAGNTRVTLRHGGFGSREVCAATRAGWETSFERLAELLAGEGGGR